MRRTVTEETPHEKEYLVNTLNDVQELYKVYRNSQGGKR